MLKHTRNSKANLDLLFLQGKKCSKTTKATNTHTHVCANRLVVQTVFVFHQGLAAFSFVLYLFGKALSDDSFNVIFGHLGGVVDIGRGVCGHVGLQTISHDVTFLDNSDLYSLNPDMTGFIHRLDPGAGAVS